MPKNDNPHSLRLIEAIRSLHGSESADAFATSHALSKSADIDKKYRWACEICASLPSHFDADEATQVRRACKCGDGVTMAREISACIGKGEGLADGCKLFSEHNKYAFLEYVNEYEVIFGYHACVCSCIKRAEGPVPELWCECSAGYAEAMFRQVFGTSVTVTLLTTAKSGADRCTFRVQW